MARFEPKPAQAIEGASAYGLDHARNCKDIMTYMKPCGAKRFLDKDIPCGEHDGMPLGLQLIGPHFGEAQVLETAAAFQRDSDWHLRHPEEA